MATTAGTATLTQEAHARDKAEANTLMSALIEVGQNMESAAGESPAAESQMMSNDEPQSH